MPAPVAAKAQRHKAKDAGNYHIISYNQIKHYHNGGSETPSHAYPLFRQGDFQLFSQVCHVQGTCAEVGVLVVLPAGRHSGRGGASGGKLCHGERRVIRRGRGVPAAVHLLYRAHHSLPRGAVPPPARHGAQRLVVVHKPHTLDRLDCDDCVLLRRLRPPTPTNTGNRPNTSCRRKRTRP